MTDSGISIAVIGQPEALEMNSLKDYLNDFPGYLNPEFFKVVYFKTTENFHKEILEQDSSFNLVLVMQNRPREYSSKEIQKLIESLPLSRILCCYSSWCESDGRNDADLWPVSLRIPARGSLPRIQIELDIIRGFKANLPLTAGREETYLHCIPEMLFRESKNCELTVFIKSSDLEFRLMLEELVESIAGHAICTQERERATVCLWDADPLNEDQVRQLKEYRKHSPNTILIPLMNFPQPEDILLLQEDFNTTGVIPKLHLTHFLPELMEQSLKEQIAS